MQPDKRKSLRKKAYDGSIVGISCSPCLPDYQTFMRGVDRSDQSMG